MSEESPEKNDNWQRGEGRGFYAENKTGELEKWILRCPKCHEENYAPAVATGMCAWCGHREVMNTPNGAK